MKDHTEAVENYLKAIYLLQQQESQVTTTALAEEMDVTPASVTAMLKKLSRMHLVVYVPYQGVTLTDNGCHLALKVLRYHRLAETYLVEILGLPWDQVHEEAHKWEHVLSELVVARMEEMLDYPVFDPHGDPIPAADGTIKQQPVYHLAVLDAGQSAVIARVKGSDPALLRYLGERDLYPGTVITVVEVAPFQGPVTVRIKDSVHVLGHAVAEQILVTQIE